MEPLREMGAVVDPMPQAETSFLLSAKFVPPKLQLNES